MKSKKLSETGEKIESGEVVQSKLRLEIDHGLWLATTGSGFGKQQYRKIKSSLKDLIYLPPWEDLSCYWKREILTSCRYVWKDEPRVLCGIMLDPREFLPNYIRRMLHRKQMDGNVPEPGYYDIQFKVRANFLIVIVHSCHVHSLLKVKASGTRT